MCGFVEPDIDGGLQEAKWEAEQSKTPYSKNDLMREVTRPSFLPLNLPSHSLPSALSLPCHILILTPPPRLLAINLPLSIS